MPTTSTAPVDSKESRTANESLETALKAIKNNHSIPGQPGLHEKSPLALIRELLGQEVVLVPVASGTKRPTVTGYPKFTAAKMADPDYLTKFTGNIGVLLGEASGGLCSIDVDGDEDFNAFLALNPQFQETLQTKGSRGGNIWFRVIDEYPSLTPVKTVDGAKWGEFRSTGGLTIVHGIHPDGMAYRRLVDAPPLDFAFDSIIWPDDLVLPWIKDEYDLLVEKEGEPIQYDSKNRFTLNEPAIAAKLALEHLTLHDMGEGSFYQYDDISGLWLIKTDDQMKNQFSTDLKLVADDLNDKRILVQRTSQRMASLTSGLKGQIGKRDVFANKRSLIHCQNGILDLAANPPVFKTFHPDFHSRNASPIAYDPEATCPRFLNELLGSALDEDDISLVQRVGGAILMGTNPAQRFLLLTGTSGGGKSTLVTIIEKLVGLQNVTELRTEHLGGRFETCAFLGKTLLTGKDVPSDFLQASGAYKIKALVGGDYQQCEMKGGSHFQFQGDFNILITCNSRLRVRLDGDHAAWHRRILAIHYDKPKPDVRVDKFADKLIAEEGSGILNFFLEGALQHLEELERCGDYKLSPRQEWRINGILRESDSVRQFVGACVVTYPAGDVTNGELNSAYFKYCLSKGWLPHAPIEFNRVLPDLMLEMRHCVPRRDIKRQDKDQRGFSGVAIQMEAQ